MFSRHDINSLKKPFLDRRPYWNLTDNDFVFAEAHAPWGIRRNERYGVVFRTSLSVSLSLFQRSTKSHKAGYVVIKANYFNPKID